jgi:hypothetical protein
MIPRRNYSAAHARAKAYGADLSSDYPEPPSPFDMSERYEELIEKWTLESVSTASAARAILDLMSTTTTDEMKVQKRDDAGPLGREKDLFHLANVLTQLTDWLNKCELREHFGDHIQIELKEATPT